MRTTTDPRTSNGAGGGLQGRPTGELLSDISSDVVTLVRQEAELAKQEIAEALSARIVAVAVGVTAAVLGVLVLVFLGLAASAALAYEIPVWAARLTVAGALGGIVLPCLPLAVRTATRPQLKPTETLRTAKEDIEWARQQLKR